MQGLMVLLGLAVLLVAAEGAASRTAIVYLANKRVQLLEKSLDLLERNVLPSNPADVLLFHTSDFNETAKQQILASRPHMRFVLVEESIWRVPDFLGPSEHVVKTMKHASHLGYRHMCRFFVLGMFKVLDQMGYEWVMRLDEDSFILDPIPYNFVEDMERKGGTYGFRMPLLETRGYYEGLPELMASFMQLYGLPPKDRAFLEELFIPPGSWPGGNESFNKFTSAEYNRKIIYNNWFICKVGFFRRPDVLLFLKYVDRSGGLYHRRWGDALVQTFTVRLFLSREELVHYTDWDYRHSFFVKKGDGGVPGWGY